MELQCHLLLTFLFHFCSQVFAEKSLLSVNMPTRLSSTNAEGGYYSSLAVDNNTSQRNHVKNVCARTDYGKNPWLEVYLLGIARITNLIIYNGDCCEERPDEFGIFVSNSTEENYSSCVHGTVTTAYNTIYRWPCHATARIVRIKLYGKKKMLELCEFQVYGEWIKKDELLSHRKKAEQSSTYYSDYKFLAAAGLAVDGITKQTWSKKSCSCTKKSIDPWWQVNLVGLARVTMVRVYNRDEHGERLNGFHVFVSNNTFAYRATCGVGPRITRNGQIINLVCGPKPGRIVGIKLPNKNMKRYLTLCEVKVYGYWIEHDELLSGDMPASQISTNAVFYAFYAVAKEHTQEKFSCTEMSNLFSWWQVHLSGLARVTFLSICSTTNCFKELLYEFNVIVSNSSQRNFVKCAFGLESPTTEPEINLKCNMTARIVRIQKYTAWSRMMSLRDVKVFGHWIEKGELLSEGMPASQSSTYHSKVYGFWAVALLAVDSDTNQEWTEKSCSATISDKNSWWQVYLAGLARVAMVTIYSSSNTEDKLTGFKVLVSQYDIEPQFTLCASDNTTIIKNSEIHSLECEADAKIVRIQLDGSGEDRYLTLCEVKVHGYWIKKDELLSYKGITKQSSIHHSNYYDFNSYSKYAVDGNTDQQWTGFSCSATENYGYHWWQVQMYGLARVKIVSIYTEIDGTLPQFKVMVANRTKQNYKECASGPSKDLSGEIVGLKCDATANKVRIQLKKFGYYKFLTLCEVKIYGKMLQKWGVLPFD